MSKHYSDKLVIRCSDDRYSDGREFDGPFKHFLAENKAKDCFLAIGFGASLEIVQEAFEPLWLDRIKTARALGISEIIVIDHIDCGKFGLEFGKMDLTEERKRHLTSLEAARRFFVENATEMKFSAYLQEGDDFSTFTRII